jgi:hypothetical protein
MRIYVPDSEAARDLVRFFRARNYLAVADPGGEVEVVPIAGRGETADRASTLSDLAAWRADHPGIAAAVMGPEAALEQDLGR